MNLIEQVKAGKKMLYADKPCTAFILPVPQTMHGDVYPIGVFVQQCTGGVSLETVTEGGFTFASDARRPGVVPDLVPAPETRQGKVWVFERQDGTLWATTNGAMVRAWSRRSGSRPVHSSEFTYEASR